MTLIYRTAAGVELALVLGEMATGHKLLPLGHSHPDQLAVLFGTAFLLDESLAIAASALEQVKRAKVRRSLAAKARHEQIAIEQELKERLQKTSRQD